MRATQTSSQNLARKAYIRLISGASDVRLGETSLIPRTRGCTSMPLLPYQLFAISTAIAVGDPPVTYMDLQPDPRDPVQACSLRYNSRSSSLILAVVYPQTQTRGSNLGRPDPFDQTGGVTSVLLWTNPAIFGEIGTHVIVLGGLLHVLTMCKHS
jgi:hypothetical protein